MARTDNVQINLNINGSRAISELNLLQSEAGKLRESMKGLKRGTEEYAKLDGQLKEVTKAMAAQQAQIGLNGMTIAQLTYKKNQLAADIRKNLIPATDEYIKKTAELNRVNARLTELRTSVQQVGSVWDQLKSKFTVTFDVGNMLAKGFDMLASSLRAVVGIAATLSDKFADIQKSTGMSAKEVGIFANTLQQMDTRTSLEGLLDIAKVGGQFGIAQKDLLAFTDTIDKVNVALGDELKGGTEEVTKVLGGLRNIFSDIKTKNVGNDILHIGNAINKLGAEGSATGDVIADFSNRIGGVGITMGLTSGQVLGVSAAMQEMNINAERGATAFTRILQEMAQAPDAFAQVAGRSSAEFKTLVNTNIYEAFKLVAQGANASSAQATVFAQVLKKLDIDGAGASEVIAKLGGNVALMDTRVKSATEGVKDASSVMGEFGIKNETTAANLEKFSKALYNIGVFFGTAFGNAVNLVSQNFGILVNWLRKVPEVTNPAIEAARREKEELKYLLAAIKNNNTSNEARIALVKELQQKYPDLSAKVGEFTDKTGKLTVNENLLKQAVKDTNSEYDRRIFILSKQEVEQKYQSQLVKSIQEEADLQKALAEQIEKGADKTKMQKELPSGQTITYTVDATIKTKKDIANEIKNREALLKDRESTMKALTDIAKRQGIDIKKIDQEEGNTKLQQQAQLQANQIQSQSDYEKEAKRLREEAKKKQEDLDKRKAEVALETEEMRIQNLASEYDREIAMIQLQSDRKIAEYRKDGLLSEELSILLTNEKDAKIKAIEQKRAADVKATQAKTREEKEKEAQEDLASFIIGIDNEVKAKEEAMRLQFTKEQQQRKFELEAGQSLDAEKHKETYEAEAKYEKDIFDLRASAIEIKLAKLAENGMSESEEAKNLANELIQIEIDKNAKILEEQGKLEEGKKELREQALSAAQQVLQFAIDSERASADARVNKVKTEWDAKIDTMKKGGKASNEAVAKAEAERDAQIDLINKARIEKERQFRAVQAIFAVADIIRNTQAEISGYFKAYAAIPGGAAIAAGLTGLAVVRAALGIAKVKQSVTQETFEDGGLLSGPSHAQGGIRGTGKFSNVEVEGGEFVNNKISTANNLPTLRMINANPHVVFDAVPRTRYRDGGQLGTSNLPTLSATQGQASDMTNTMMAVLQQNNSLMQQILGAIQNQKIELPLLVLQEKLNEVKARQAETTSKN